MRSENEYLWIWSPLNRRTRVPINKNIHLHIKLNNVKRLGDYTGNLSQIPPFPLYKLAEVEGNGSWAPRGKGREGQCLHQGHRRGHGHGRRERAEGRQQEPAPCRALIPSLPLSPFWLLSPQSRGTATAVTARPQLNHHQPELRSSIPQCIPETTPPSMLTPLPPALLNAQQSLE